MRQLAILAACILLAGCAGRAPVETELQVIRTYGWQASVVDPEPDWSPDSTTLVARSLGGFSLLQEGGKGERTYVADDRRETCFPRWTGLDTFVFGPATNAMRATDGRVVHPGDGITRVTLGEGKPSRRQISPRGYMPKPGAEGSVWAQAADRIIVIDAEGEVAEFGDGFDPEPQRGGPGLCWRDLPASGTDWWTGRNGAGTMLVRWRAGSVDQVPGAVQAGWTRQGGVILTVIDTPAPAGRPWWAGKLRLVHLAGPGAPPATLRPDARDPAPHPLAELLAWVDGTGGVWVGTIRPDGWSERVSAAGSAPRWSPDGLRLVWLEAPAAGQQLPGIRVAVLGRRQ